MKKLILIFVLIIFGCKQIQEKSNEMGIRVLIESDKSDESTVKVFLEDKTGNAVTAARVICIDKYNRAELLEFDSSKYYYWKKTYLPASGNVIIYVKTNAAAQEKKLTIPHEKILESAQLIVFQDSSGKSILKGESVSNTDDIQIAWKSCGKNCIYTVEVKNTFDTVYSYATNACNIIIPANTLKKNNNYRLVVTAQKYFGDPLLEKYNYYSVSSIQTGGINFAAE
ncbi:MULTISPECIES: hypothetical protein [unclassified Treponema]|uniref:hypothetical protein n=1 Tax=unclassified Treponema TaxID=2638727 RepID=UPI0020A44606|nr:MULTISPECIES: hypothetical protein [unclassified Treponema]UTC68382.1 hypothetical protein E4O06_07065 [Treponema sp. OMZ 789]UTC71102.1 hypothetical protein E4O01_07205 [Treponema sp. OMZ 790]UTC73843.1 hypothetical protein E4O02_07400 [Treponema sp. OMZ 791]